MQRTHLVAADGVVRSVATLDRGVEKHVDHRPGEASGGTELEVELLLHVRARFAGAGQQVGVLWQDGDLHDDRRRYTQFIENTRHDPGQPSSHSAQQTLNTLCHTDKHTPCTNRPHLHRDEVFEDGVDVRLVRGLPLGLGPPLDDVRHLQDLLDVQVLAQTHRDPGLGHRDRDAVQLEGVHEDDSWGDDVRVGGGAGPVQDGSLRGARDKDANIDTPSHNHGRRAICCCMARETHLQRAAVGLAKSGRHAVGHDWHAKGAARNGPTALREGNCVEPVGEPHHHGGAEGGVLW